MVTGQCRGFFPPSPALPSFRPGKQNEPLTPSSAVTRKGAELGKLFGWERTAQQADLKKTNADFSNRKFQVCLAGILVSPGLECTEPHGQIFLVSSTIPYGISYHLSPPQSSLETFILIQYQLGRLLINWKKKAMLLPHDQTSIQYRTVLNKTPLGTKLNPHCRYRTVP